MFYITNPVNLANLAANANHAIHVDLYILKEPPQQSVQVGFELRQC